MDMSSSATAASGGTGCTYRFQHAAKPRAVCDVEAVPGSSLCIWHDVQLRPHDFDLAAALVRAVEQPDHWLEGAVLSDRENLRSLKLFRARLPYADFENVDLSDTVLAESCLDHAVFRSATLNRTILSSSSLVGAILAGATGDRVQLENVDLSEASLEGMTLDGARLSGIRLSLNSRVHEVEWGRIKEIYDGDFRKAAFVLRQLSLQLRPIDSRQADRFYFLEMTARHLWATGAREFPDGSWRHRVACWFAPRRPNMILPSIGWALHRWIWGYAVRPFWTLIWMLVVVLFFALIFHRVGIVSNPPAPSSPFGDLAVSLVTFATLGYGNRTPFGFHGEILGGLEAISGMLLSSMFLVALVNRYAQRG
jgi:hypothetical protein